MAQGSSKAGGCGCGADQAASLQRRTLWVVLLINATSAASRLLVSASAVSTTLAIIQAATTKETLENQCHSRDNGPVIADQD
ncbi:hypothetical protein KBY75_14870 [Cyanobium sp. T1G-Tous]|uniref:hypothetical protein n=1 Tax=Cyanobium sp. T1G-Tous TaxID=2823722 RepID=UPI0020CF9759|nr:hypothetical protein [Cyanobium sp. T1G-Tous]MCP9804837.1 hypothetical protein [Cyanobium sp. T1G-Tous]